MPATTTAAEASKDALKVFTERRTTKAERRAEGKRLRAALPLDSHSELPPADEARDALGLLRAQESNRESELAPLRYGRMSASPFAYLRGAAAVMAADLGAGPQTGIAVQLCGDAHVANFGMFAAADRHLVFDLNDFDETLPGPFEWDVKRLAASVVVAGRHVGIKDSKAVAAARASVGSYRTTMARLARMTPLEVWYARVDVEDLIARLRKTSLLRDAQQASKASRRNTGDVAAGKLTETGPDGVRRFRARPPLLVPVDEDTNPGITRHAADLYARYLTTLEADRVVLLLRYGFCALAHKVVGVGSVGTHALVLLLASGDGEPLVLQIKQAGQSVLEPVLAPAAQRTAGERVVVGQRLLQATGDQFLGWARGPGTGARRRDYYVRQLRDMKGSIDLEALTTTDLATYGQLCGAVLARAHARAGSAATVAGYLGNSSAFDAAVGSWALAYADRTDADHAQLTRAVADGVVPAVSL